MIFGAPKARWELRLASKRLLTSDFEFPEAAWAAKRDKESPEKPPTRFQVTIHRPCRSIMSSAGALPDIDISAVDLRPLSALVIFVVDVVPLSFLAS